jgi:hypothetical protein
VGRAQRQRRHVLGVDARRRSRSGWAASSLCELDVLEGYTSTAASAGLSQGWERSYLDAAYTPFRFAVPRGGHTRIAHLWFDHTLLVPVAVQELD